jgi:hypothetical protein
MTIMIASKQIIREGSRRKGSQEAVDLFSPYAEIKDANPDARAATVELIRRTLLKQAISKLFLYVNNRLEGNALLTIMAVLERLETKT